MDNIILTMLKSYSFITDEDYTNSLKEIIQEIALLGLWRSKFFEHAAFYGGTALRILYQLDRFSEDLDFSLLKPNPKFLIEPYLKAIETELTAFGFTVEAEKKQKNIDTAINSAFLKANTLEHLLKIKAPLEVQKRCHVHSLLKIKLEVDTDPPAGFLTETIHLFKPIPFWVNAYSLPDLFAGKVCAVLTRNWKQRIKGRDWYDLLWFIQRATPIHLQHLENRLRDTHFYRDVEPLTPEKMITLLNTRIEHLDIDLAKKDISTFIKNQSQLDGWSKQLFFSAVNQMKVK